MVELTNEQVLSMHPAQLEALNKFAKVRGHLTPDANVKSIHAKFGILLRRCHSMYFFDNMNTRWLLKPDCTQIAEAD